MLSANSSGILKWWVDAYFTVHPNMRRHSEGGLYMGHGFPIAGFTKQKLNSRSSTEIEISGVDNFMPAIFWEKYFLDAQSYNVQDNCLYQDNKSYIILENNGKSSSRKRTKHINIQYLFITDCVAKSELYIVW